MSVWSRAISPPLSSWDIRDCLKSVALNWSSRNGYWMSTTCQIWHLEERVVGICLCARPGLPLHVSWRASWRKGRKRKVYISAQTHEHRLVEWTWDRRLRSCWRPPASSLFFILHKGNPSRSVLLWLYKDVRMKVSFFNVCLNNVFF